MFWAVFMRFSSYLVIGCKAGEVSPQGLVHDLPLQFFTLRSSKIKVSQTRFFDTVIT